MAHVSSNNIVVLLARSDNQFEHVERRQFQVKNLFATRTLLLPIFLMLLLFGFGYSKNSQNRPFLGTWKVVKMDTLTPQRSAIWVFSNDGICNINVQQGTWTENNGLLKIVKPRTGEYRFNWKVNNNGKQLVLTAASDFAGGQLPPITLEKVE